MARYNYSKKISGYKWAITLIILLSLLVVALAVVSSGFKNWDVKTWFPKENEEIVCEHEFDNGVCVKCEMPEEEIVCEHEFDNGVCVKCEMSEEEMFENDEIIENELQSA